MKIFNFIFISFICTLATAKIPDSPLYKLQTWAKNNGGPITSFRYSNKKKPFTYDTCAGNDLNLESAWDISTGSKKVIVAVIDDGFHIEHKNLKSNIWRNPGESGLDKNNIAKESNEIDDEGNGYIDDLYGFNFYDHNSDPGPCIWDVDRHGKGQLECNTFHGTLALGFIGAEPNSKFGIAGINWQSSMMLLKISSQNGVGSDNSHRAANISEAIRYAADNGAKIINWSGFLDKSSKAEEKLMSAAFEYAKSKGVLIVLCAGNELLNLDLKKNKNKLPFPVKFDFDNAIYIASIDPCGELADEEKDKTNTIAANGNHFIGGSNYGLRTFIAAPGVKSMTTEGIINGNELWFLGDGTSSAAPMVSGVAALILSANPDLDYKDLKNILCDSAKKTDSLKGKVKCNGMVDAAAALKLAKTFKK